MNDKRMDVSTPWYRHRWPWLLMLGPFLVIVAGAVTVYLAVRSNDGLVDDDYYKQGLAVNMRTARDRQALALGLQAKLSVDRSRRLIRVELLSSRQAKLPDVVKLFITHPTRSGMDHIVLLHSDGHGGYAAGFADVLSGRWHVSLEDESRSEWRLSGDWVLEQQPVLAVPESGVVAERQ